MARILVVDDDDTIRELLTRVLERDGYEVECAGDGDEALKKYFETSVDLVITDLIMPGKEGLETISDFKRSNPKVKVVAISGGGLINPHLYLDLSKRLGADMTFVKPFDIFELRQGVKKLLEQ